MMKTKCAAFLLLLFSTSAFAWFCPNNFNLIQAGDTLDKIKQQCGKPLSEKKSEEEAKTPQEWVYYVAIDPPNPTIKTTIEFDKTGIATNITVNTMSLVSTGICGGTISVGNTMKAVKAVCGSPSFINKGQAGNEKSIIINELTYGGPAPNILVFENGILRERR